jgi:hypothetical protein
MAEFLTITTVWPVAEFFRYSGSRQSGSAQRNAVPYSCFAVASVGTACSIGFDDGFFVILTFSQLLPT